MYATHFELDGPLFRTGVAQDEALLVGDPDAYADLTTHARIALSTPDAAIVLVGPPGVGKTTQAGAVLRAVTGSARTAVVWLRTPPATPHELLESLLVELGLEPYKQSRAERLQSWRQLLVELAATETRVFVALERANEAAAGVLRALDALTAADPHGCAGTHLILMGPDDFRQTLDDDALVGLRQRIRLVRRIDPLDAAGVATYLEAAVERAGGDFDRMLAPDAIDALASLSGGIPRVLHHLADSALAVAALRGEPLLTGALVHEVAADVYGLGPEPARSAGEPDRAAPDAGELRAADSDDEDEDGLIADGDDVPFVDTVAAPAAEPREHREPTVEAPALDDALAETASVELDDEPAWAESGDDLSAEPADDAPYAIEAADSSDDAGAEEIPVLTDWIDDRPAPPNLDDLDMLDAAETLTLLGDDVDAFAAEISAELLAAEDDGEPDASAAAKPTAAAR